MSVVIPTVAEYAGMSWHARQEITKRLRRELNAKARRERLRHDAILHATAAKAEAETIFGDLDLDDPITVAERRRVLANDYWMPGTRYARD